MLRLGQRTATEPEGRDSYRFLPTLFAPLELFLQRGNLIHIE